MRHSGVFLCSLCCSRGYHISHGCHCHPHCAPRPRPEAPLAMPLPPLAALVAPPRVGMPPPLPARGMPPRPRPMPDVLEAGAGVCGVWNLEATLLLGGFSTKDVSVVRKVASISSTPWLRLRLAAPRSRWFCGLLKDSAIGACAMHQRRASSPDARRDA
jgi:hypothetical protein